MVVRIITVHVQAGSEADFEEKTIANHTGSLGEPGVLRFDVLKDEDQPGTYYLYEVYRDTEATVAHKETEHYHAWMAAVADLIIGERTSVTCSPVAPRDEGSW
ncbi:MAG: antibiotic biosynthesis monooxygenase [Spirochaeta sp.]|nr:antibiotic biosynthesis monooxygenase [Spirochaeta sp.]